MTIPRGAVRAVSFDYGNVLGGLDFDELGRRLASLGRAADVEQMRHALERAYAAHDGAIADGLGHEAGWRGLMRVFLRAGWGLASATPEPRDDDEAIVDALWAMQPKRNLWRHVAPAARELLAALSAAGVPMVVTSNSEGGIAALLEELGIARFFVGSVDSGVLGFAKPDRRIFEAAAAVVGVVADAAGRLSGLVHVGDSEAADIVGALEAGAHAIRFDGFVPGSERQPTVADARTSTHAELRALLGDALGRHVRE